jgi:hypothetical protein
MRDLALFLLAFLLLFPTSLPHATIIHEPGDSTTIQGGINGAIDGDAEMVTPGTYVTASITRVSGHDFVLTGPTPGIAGEENTLSVNGVTPYERVYFVYGFVPGSFNVPGCPGVTVGINSPRILGFSEADSKGNASYTVFVPGGASQRTILFQAVEIANCRVSNLVEYTFAPGSFERTYGGSDWEKGASVQQTTDGGYIVAGYTDSFGSGFYDVYLIKTDPSGETLWTRTYGGNNSDYGASVQQTTDGGYIVTGYTASFGAGLDDVYNVYLIKTDPSGDTLWTRTYGGSVIDRGSSVQQTTDGGYIVVGDTDSFGAGFYDVYLIKTDSSGDTLWTRTYGGNSSDYGYSVQQTTDGGYIVAGKTRSFGPVVYDVYLFKTDSAGNTLWERTYGGSDYESGNSVQQTMDGGYIVAGRTESVGAGYADVYLIRTNASGDTLWTRTYGGSDWDVGESVQLTKDGGYVITGRTESFGAGYADVYLIKTDPDSLIGIDKDDSR